MVVPMAKQAKINWHESLEVNILCKSEVSKAIGDSRDYYVYILWKMYEEPPLPFYVGKGHFQRVLKHGVKSDENNNRYKTNVIKKHYKSDLELGYSIFDFFKDEYEALDKEKDLIALIGRADLNLGPLTNKTDGGDGTKGHLALKGSDNPSARTVVADGVNYGCLKDASIVLNINSSALVARIRNGWAGCYYKDEGQREQTKKIVGCYKKPVFVEGKEFESASEAARKLGGDVRQISKRIKYGWPDYYYMDVGQLPRKTNWSNREDKVSVIIKGEQYPTIADAVKSIGESTAMISKRCLSSNYPEYIRIDGKCELKSTPPKKPEKVLVYEHSFPSLGDAARFYNMTDGGIAFRCRSDNYPDWMFADIEKQQKESFTPEFSSISVPVKIDGIHYPSQSAAALAHNVDISTLKRRCKSLSFPKWKCDMIKKEEPKDGRAGLIGVEIDGVNYRSVNQASAKLGIHRSVINRKIKSNEFPTYNKLN